MKIRVRTVAILVLGLLSLVVIIQNTEVVSVRLLFRDLVMSRITLLALSIAVGLTIGFLLGKPWRKQAQIARSRPAGEDDLLAPSSA